MSKNNNVYKKIVFSLLICFFSIPLISINFTVSASETTCKTTENSILYELAEIEDKYSYLYDSNVSDRAIAAKGQHILIYTDELNYFTEKALINSDMSYDEAKNLQLEYLIKREVLCYEAIQNNFMCSDKEVSEYINEQKKLFENAENYDEYKLYISSLNLTIDEYWERQFDAIKKDLIISDYLNSLKKQIADENELTFYSTYTQVIDTKSDDTAYLEYEKLEGLWNDFYQNLLDTLIQKENIFIY